MTKWGVSCVTVRDGNITPECGVAEIRNIVDDSQIIFWDDVHYCLENNIYAIINITNEANNNYTELAWRKRIDGLVYELLKLDYSGNKFRITIDNEPMKYISKERYSWFVNVACDQVKYERNWKHVKIGAGNEEFSMAKGEFYPYMLANCPDIDVIDTHWQAAVIDPKTMRVSEEALNYWGNVVISWSKQYNKTLSCTEANWCDVSTDNGYNDLLKICNKVEEIKCQDLCIVFIDYRTTKYAWLSFLVNGIDRSNGHWDLFKKIMLSKKEQDMEMDKTGYNKGDKGVWVKFIQDTCNEAGPLNDPDTGVLMPLLKVDGVYGTKTEKAVRSFQSENELKSSGWSDPPTLEFMIVNFGEQYRRLNFRWMMGER